MQSEAFQQLIWCKSEHEMTENAVQDDADCKTTPFKTLSKSTKITTRNALKQPFIFYLFTLKRAVFWLSFLTKHKTIRHIFPRLSSYSNCVIDFPFCQFCSLITGNTNHIAGRTKPTERLIHYPQAAFQRRLACQFYSVDCA